MAMGRIVTLAAASVLLATFVTGTASAAEELPLVSHDGLELVKKGRQDVVYRRAGVDLAGYTRIMFDPMEVDFRKQWTQDFRRVSTSDRERIRRDLAEEARRVFVKELQEKGSYEIVESPAPDVLREALDEARGKSN